MNPIHFFATLIFCFAFLVYASIEFKCDYTQLAVLKTTYAQKLLENRETYPFQSWKEYYKEGLKQYTINNCDWAEHIMDHLIFDLASLGENAEEYRKIKLFKKAVISYNLLNNYTDNGLIESGERDELFELIDNIGKSAGINPKNYGGGEGLASEWRDW